jgi:hypothetical protein
MTSVTIGVAKMPVKTFLFWAFSAALCVISASSALKQTVNAEDAEGRRERRENPQPYFFIRVNQVGFAPSDVKTAIAVTPQSLPEQFYVMNIKTGVVVFGGDVKPIPESWGQFNVHGEVDFSSVTQEGDYIVAVGNWSTYFRISRTANTQLPDQLLEFMRQQRCGYNPFVDAVCHSFDGRTAFGPGCRRSRSQRLPFTAKRNGRLRLGTR